MKKVLGLDLGTTSIGWALVNQAENASEESSIIKAGVRVNPLTADEKGSFESGKDITTNADRRLKRTARRNLQRYKLRRDNLVALMKQLGWIDDSAVLSEQGNHSTFETYRLRAKAASEMVSLGELARVLLMINKKRGYKSSRKAAKSDEETGRLIDGMTVAKELYDNNLTPAQYSLALLEKKPSMIKRLPDYYRSDLNAELDLVWNRQKQYYPDILTDELRSQISGKAKMNTAKIFLAKYGIYTAENKGKDKVVQALKWRADAVSEKVPEAVVAYVISDLNGEISSSSGYLGQISDRSKELYFKGKTVGQYLMDELDNNPNFRVRGKVFYRQDYLDEFERIWETQAKFYPSLTQDLKREFRDIVIFYQRRLKSQKGLVSYCEFESRKLRMIVDGKEKVVEAGCRVAPKSSLMFQDFKVWTILNNIQVRFDGGESRFLEYDEKVALAEELSVRESMKAEEVAGLLFGRRKGIELNYKKIEGNRTMAAFYSKFIEIVNLSGHGEYDVGKMSYKDVVDVVTSVFEALGFSTDILKYDSYLDKEEYEQQPIFKLWHLLYSYEGDKSKTGNKSLVEKIASICSMSEDYASVIAGITFENDYASLSHKAMSRILPKLKEGLEYSVACEAVGYRHSKDSLTREEIESRPLAARLQILPKNSLRNPVVEKILNQMVNVVNAVMDKYGRPDEVHIELARELKMSKDDRADMTSAINKAQKENEEIVSILKNEFGLSYVSKTDVLRYKLYRELAPRGYKTLYSDRCIPKEILFSKEIDIEHIIPQALLFNDSYANKTLEFRDVNLEKGKMTAMDYVRGKYGVEGAAEYKARVEDLFRNSPSKAKRNYLLMTQSEIPKDFINRDLRDSQYIAKKAKEMLQSVSRTVVSTTGAVTAKLREDWRLVNVMQELNWDKYEQLGMTYTVARGDGHQVRKIREWTKRNDHRHHAMDAITIAFTKPVHIQYLNNLNSKSDKSSSIYGIMAQETHLEGSARIFNPPMPFDVLRSEVKSALDSILVSFKSKNKVVTKNINKTRKRDGFNKAVSLTPRGSLHEESVYGMLRQYETYYVAVNKNMTYDQIESVASKSERDALKCRLDAFGGDAKKAFSGKNSLDKSPLYLDEYHSKAVPSKVKCVRFRTLFKKRKDIDDKLNLSKVVDGRIRKILDERLKACGNDPKKAFLNLDTNPIYYDEQRQIPLKKVTVAETYSLAALHSKHDNNGNVVRDAEGNAVPADYINMKNNHHIAIYVDPDGNYQEHVVTFFEAVNRSLAGLPVVDKEFGMAAGWRFVFSMKINEMFVFPDPENGFFPEEIDLKDPANYPMISRHLFRVQKLSSKYYCFRHHLETNVEDTKELQNITWIRVQSLQKLAGVVKIRINHLGEIVALGEQ